MFFGFVFVAFFNLAIAFVVLWLFLRDSAYVTGLCRTRLHVRRFVVYATITLLLITLMSSPSDWYPSVCVLQRQEYSAVRSTEKWLGFVHCHERAFDPGLCTHMNHAACACMYTFMFACMHVYVCVCACECVCACM